MDGQKVWVVKDVKLQPMCAGEGQQAPYRASPVQPMETDARPIPARSHRDARDGALEKADGARDGAQRRRQSVSRIVTAPRMRNLIRSLMTSDCLPHSDGA